MNKVSPQLTEILTNLASNDMFVTHYDKILKACFLNLLSEDNNLKTIN